MGKFKEINIDEMNKEKNVEEVKTPRIRRHDSFLNKENVKENKMDIQKIVQLVVYLSSEFTTASEDKEITVGEFLKIIPEIAKILGIDENVVVSLKKPE